MAVLLPTTLAQVLTGHSRERPDATALRFEGERLDYREFARQADHAARVLFHDWGVRAGDRVAWLGGNHPAQLVLLFALARIGAMLLPLNFRLAPTEWDALVADCMPRHLVHDSTWAVAATALAARNGLAAHKAASVTDPGTLARAPELGSADSPVLLVYTSGTTRQPKAAVHTQGNLLANMRIAAQVQQITAADSVATMLPLFHVGGLCIQTLPALGAGAPVILLSRFTPDAAFDCFANDRPTLTLQVPATMKALVDHPRWREADFSSLRAVWAGSSLLPAPLVDAFHARGVPVCNVYGATETGPFSIALAPEHAMQRAGSCGWPAPEVEVRLGNFERGVGEVLLRAPNVVQHYWPGHPACDTQGWFHTGDLASQAQDGAFTIVGRARDLIISGGENIHPAEIEGLLAEHADVLECAAFGLPDAQWGEMVAVAVVMRPGAARDQAVLSAHLQARLARYKLPRRWYWMDALPKTALGKVQRQSLVAIARAAQA